LGVDYQLNYLEEGMTDIKENIKEFAEIAASVPDNLQSICFEILLRNHLASIADDRKPPRIEKLETIEPQTPIEPEDPGKTQADIVNGDLHMKSKKFLEKYSVSLDDINNLFYKEGQEIRPLYEDLKTTRIAEVQIRVSLLQALRNAFTSGEFTANVEAIRAECKDRKSYDSPNFTTNFKNNKSLFDFDNYNKNTTSIRLSEEGKKELSQLIKELQ
jgi:hypothetical protein